MLPAHRVIGHREYGNTPPGGWAGRKTDPTYSMDWRRNRVAAFKPRSGGDDPMAALSDAEQRRLLENTDLIAQQIVGPNKDGWEAWRFGLGAPGKPQPKLTVVDYLRSLDRELNGWLGLDGRPSAEKDTMLGQILSVRALVKQLTDQVAQQQTSLAGGKPPLTADNIRELAQQLAEPVARVVSEQLAQAVVDELGRRVSDRDTTEK